jgi:hypothetical protein
MGEGEGQFEASMRAMVEIFALSAFSVRSRAITASGSGRVGSRCVNPTRLPHATVRVLDLQWDTADSQNLIAL